MMPNASRVQVSVRDEGGAQAEGSLEFFSDRIVRIAFWDAPPALPMGSLVQMIFESPNARESIRINGRVRTRRDDEHEEHAIYGVRLHAARSAREALARFIAAALNRRRSYRAAPPDERVLHATLDAELEPGRRRRVVGRVLDISATGCSLELSTAADAAMTAASNVGLHLPLSGSEAPVYMAGQIRHRVYQSGVVRYGISFEAATTPGFRGQQDRIVREVMRWQRKALSDVHKVVGFS